MLGDAGLIKVDARMFDCFHLEKTPEEAVEEFYGMGNPSVQLLRQGFDDDFVERSKVKFLELYKDIYRGGLGEERQKEVAILAVGTKPTI